MSGSSSAIGVGVLAVGVAITAAISVSIGVASAGGSLAGVASIGVVAVVVETMGGTAASSGSGEATGSLVGVDATTGSVVESAGVAFLRGALVALGLASVIPSSVALVLRRRFGSGLSAASAFAGVSSGVALIRLGLRGVDGGSILDLRECTSQSG